MASRKEEKERRRRERLARQQAEREQARRRRIYATAAGSVLVVAAVAAVAVAIVAGAGGGDGASDFPVEGTAPPEQRVSVLNDAVEEARCRVRHPPIEGRNHVTTQVEYGTNPPTSGNHNPQPAEDGTYGEAPSLTPFVHSLEHGRVLYWYKPSLERQRLAQLKGLYDEDPYHILVVPNEQMPFAVAATAWGHLMGCRSVSDETFDALRTFRDRYRDKGPEFVP